MGRLAKLSFLALFLLISFALVHEYQWPLHLAPLSGAVSLKTCQGTRRPLGESSLESTLPLSSSDRWIIDKDANQVAYVGINWPGATDTMLPEGLGYQSISEIVRKIATLGFNVVRLTFAIELVDEILDHGGDVTIRDALINALGDTNGTAILKSVIANNPQFTAETTRLQVFDAVAAELANQNIYLHLDNHVSKAMWCCSSDDGNSWFGDTYFNVTNWVRGLSYMAEHGSANWPTFSSIGLRNELRQSTSGSPNLEPYTWSVWKTHMITAASAVYAANPAILIFFSGFNYDTTIAPAVAGHLSLEPDFRFSISEYEFASKFVFEIHTYDKNITDCTSFEQGLLDAGTNSTITNNGDGNRAPVVFTEWGHDETDASKAYQSVYATCLSSFFPKYKLGWMLWVVTGSYYIREGIQDFEETWGILNHTCSGYRSERSVAAIKADVQATFQAYEQLC